MLKIFKKFFKKSFTKDINATRIELNRINLLIKEESDKLLASDDSSIKEECIKRIRKACETRIELELEELTTLETIYTYC